MKKAFEILAYTLLELVIYILLLSGLYYLFCYLILNNTGSPILYSQPSFWACLFRFTPSGAIFSILLLIFSFIKRNCTFREMIIPYVIISALVWIVLVPVALYCDSGMTPGFAQLVESIPASTEMKEMFIMPAWSSYMLSQFDKLHVQLVLFINGGTLRGIINYASFFLSLAAIGCFARFSAWRLWNVFFVIFAFGASVVLNSYLFDIDVMYIVGQRLNATFAELPNLFSFLKASPEAWAEKLPVVVNAAIFLLYTLFGVLSLIGSANKERR